MESREKQALIQKMTRHLFRSYAQKGLSTAAYRNLMQDVHRTLSPGGRFTVDSVNNALIRLGWPDDMMSNYTFELIVTLFELQHNYDVKAIPITDDMDKGDQIVGI